MISGNINADLSKAVKGQPGGCFLKDFLMGGQMYKVY
jgi:hypothetical protein